MAGPLSGPLSTALGAFLVNYRAHRQGTWDNCWFRAALDALTFHRPDEIHQLVRAAEDGFFEVTFRDQNLIKVKPDLRDDAPYATALELAANVDLGDATTPRFLSYGVGITILTGKGRTGYTNASGVGFDNALRHVPIVGSIARSLLSSFEGILAQATASKRVMVLGGSDGQVTTVKVPGLVNRHCYALFCYEPEHGTCRIRDPRGNDDLIPSNRKRDGYGVGEFYLSLDELQSSFCGLAVEND
jgi:hypothetical protein